MISYKDMRNQQDRLSLFPTEGLAREVLDLSVCTGAKVFAMSWWDTHRIS